MNTRAGGVKLRQSMIEIHGSEEAWKDWMREIGKSGGMKRHPNKGFGNDKERARMEGAKGGLKSKRIKKAKSENKVRMGYAGLPYDESNFIIPPTPTPTPKIKHSILGNLLDRMKGTK